MRSGSGNNHGHREDVGGWRDLGKNTGIRTEIRAHVVEGDDIIYLTSWPEDSRSVSVEVDKVSNSSQTKLKADEKNDLPAADAPSEIRKATPISS